MNPSAPTKQSRPSRRQSNFDSALLTRSLMRDAKALGIPMGSAEIFIAHTVKAVEHSLKSTPSPTDSTISRAVVHELRKYHPDLSYLYQYRDKII